MSKSALFAAAGFYGRLPLAPLVFGHSLTVCTWFKNGHQDRWLLNFWVTLFAAFGGGMVSALLVQEPSKASNSLFTKNAVGVYYALAWWAVNYCPGDLVSRLYSLLPIRMAGRGCLAILRAGLIVHRVNATAALFPGVVAAPLVIGTIAGCGGKVIVDAIDVACQTKKGPTELAQPGFALWSGLLAALANYLLVHVGQLLSEAEGLALVTTVLLAHALAAEATGLPLDFTEPFVRAFHLVTGIPQPGVVRSIKERAARKPTLSNPATPAPSATKQPVAKVLDDDSNKAPRDVPLNPAKAAAAITPGRVTRRRQAALAAAGSD
ncbi:hypothetical protein N2152v2_005624 [Parachlorella kessleri]